MPRQPKPIPLPSVTEDRYRSEMAVMIAYRPEFERHRRLINANADRREERRNADPLFDYKGYRV